MSKAITLAATVAIAFTLALVVALGGAGTNVTRQQDGPRTPPNAYYHLPPHLTQPGLQLPPSE